MSELDIAPAFDGDWAGFAARYWGRRPVLFKGTTTAPFAADEVFRGAASAASTGTPPDMPLTTQFTVERLRQTRRGTYLPAPSDRSFDAYERRVAEVLDGRRYALISGVLHAFDRGVWERERSFFAGLWEEVGAPFTGAITTLFHGTYEHSPVGVHLDRFATFMYVLRGSKRMRFWRQRPWTDPVSTVLDYERYLSDSFVAEADAGDLLYWPSFYYHVGESAGGGPATSVNVGVPWDHHRARHDIDDLLLDIRAEELSPAETVAGLPGITEPMFARGAGGGGVLAASLPPALRQAAHVVRQLGRQRLGNEHVTVRSLRRLTAAGFEPVPEPAATPEPDSAALVRGDTRFPVLWSRDVGHGCVCAANGHVVRTRTGPERLSRLLDLLNSGEPQHVATLLKGYRPAAAPLTDPLPATRAGMRELLRRLESFGALTRL